jgi:hypothetical protein
MRIAYPSTHSVSRARKGSPLSEYGESAGKVSKTDTDLSLIAYARFNNLKNTLEISVIEHNAKLESVQNPLSPYTATERFVQQEILDAINNKHHLNAEFISTYQSFLNEMPVGVNPGILISVPNIENNIGKAPKTKEIFFHPKPY